MAVDSRPKINSTNGEALYGNISSSAGEPDGAVNFEADLYANTSRVGYTPHADNEDYRVYENFAK